MAWDNYQQKRMKWLELQNTEMKSIIKKLVVMSGGVQSWPNDTEHNIIRLSLTDLNILDEPSESVPVYRCHDCMIEIPKHIAEKTKRPRCNSCYAKRKKEQRGGR